MPFLLNIYLFYKIVFVRRREHGFDFMTFKNKNIPFATYIRNLICTLIIIAYFNGFELFWQIDCGPKKNNNKNRFHLPGKLGKTVWDVQKKNTKDDVLCRPYDMG